MKNAWRKILKLIRGAALALDVAVMLAASFGAASMALAPCSASWRLDCSYSGPCSSPSGSAPACSPPARRPTLSS